ncbi:ubiquitin-conjugating enzyme E2 (macronuclear) [Tetrahymena thermophila SB210]|uniref:Ubiquitin-conjugating enzyme E2 n=1 Tax=Tetrahymena thermophila (strain SB210) TaxID=312017 RepID=Q22BX5_TETTS|nr:ubiquitin-conjugating enzyme E2 [Tetrahymena thermophila SB210]EAR82783.2 ubiquitin-conjugating enzyme E2 [Tetrahymena thermophila SB210]|eukprot:XP_001030446.2 ubiquitin-conjugating enzyme E2 [Tetrahymena thermophila SB210]
MYLFYYKFKEDIIGNFYKIISQKILFDTFKSFKCQQNKFIIYNFQQNSNLIKKKGNHKKMSQQQQQYKGKCNCSFCNKFSEMEGEKNGDEIEECKENQSDSSYQNDQQYEDLKFNYIQDENEQSYNDLNDQQDDEIEQNQNDQNDRQDDEIEQNQNDQNDQQDDEIEQNQIYLDDQWDDEIEQNQNDLNDQQDDEIEQNQINLNNQQDDEIEQNQNDQNDQQDDEIEQNQINLNNQQDDEIEQNQNDQNDQQDEENKLNSPQHGQPFKDEANHYLESDSQMIQDCIGQFSNLKAVQRQNKVNRDFMENFVTQYPTSDLSLPDISFHFKPDGSQAILFYIFCQPEILQKCVAKRNDIAELYYDSKGFTILLVINPKIYYENYEQKYQEFNSNEIPLEVFISNKFENQQKILNKIGLQTKGQIKVFPLIKNLRLRGDLYELFECLNDQFEFNYLNCSDHCFAYYTQSDNLNQLEGLIIGPKDTPYEGIPYTVTIVIPEDYPTEPPKVTFNQQILHPNISESGEICLNILQDKWSTVLTIQKVLVSIVSLLYEKNLDDVYNHYAKTLYKEDPEGFKTLIKKQSILQDSQKLKIDFKQLAKVPINEYNGYNEYEINEEYYNYDDANDYMDVEDE